MIKTDAQVQRDVIAELSWEPSIAAEEIGVACKHGVVTLSGQVSSYPRKYAAAQAAERVGGVRAVVDQVVVELPPMFTRTDSDLAHCVASVLNWDVNVPDHRVKARVENGWVWIEGEIDWHYQSAAAERAVRNLIGVRGVTNLLKVQKHISVSNVQERIQSALQRHAELGARQIEVRQFGGRVMLQGEVESWIERREAERTAWNAPGVSSIDDELVVRT